jgi:hypothetical protein
MEQSGNSAAAVMRESLRLILERAENSVPNSHVR